MKAEHKGGINRIGRVLRENVRAKAGHFTITETVPQCTTGYVAPGERALFFVPQCTRPFARYIFGLPYCATCADQLVSIHAQLNS